LASFFYERGADHVCAVPHRLLSPGFILDSYHHCVLPLILPALGIQVLHASAVARSAGVAALCGVSGTGKSTMAVALARRGYTIWADDAVAVDTGNAEPMAIPLPFTVRLRPGSDRCVAAAGQRDVSRAAAAVDELTPLAALCMLRRTSGVNGAVTVKRLEPAAACQAALAHAYCFSVKDAAQKRRTISSYLTLTAWVPTYEIRFRPGLEHLPTVLDAIESTIGG
jgi:predicted ATPase